jgi:PAS domain S-box-containing protein
MPDDASPKLAIASPRHSSPIVAVAALGGVTTAIGILGALASADLAWVRFFDNFHWTAAHLTAAALALLSVPRAEGADRIVRKWFAAGLCVYGLAEILYDLQVLSAINVFPGPSDAFSILFGPLCLLGLVAAIRSATMPAGRLAIWLDIAGGALVVNGLTLALYLPALGSFSGVQLFVLAAYPVTILTAAVAGFVFVIHARPRLGASPLIFLGSLVAIGSIWMEWNRRALTGELVDGGWLNIAFSLSALGLGLGAASWRTQSSSSQQYWRICATLMDALPMIVVLGAVVSLLVTVSETGVTRETAAITYSATGVVVIGIIRQSYLIRRMRKSGRPAEEAQIASSVASAMATEDKSPRIGSWEHDVASDKDICSAEACEIFGLAEKSDGPLENWKDAIDPRDRPRATEDFDKAVMGIVPSYATQFRIQHPKLGERWISERGWVERDSSGHALKVYGWSWDITERRALESDLASNKRRLDLALSAGGIGLWEWSPVTDEKTHDPHWLTMMGYGYDEETRPDSDHWAIVHPEDRDYVAKCLEEYLAGGSERYECLYRTRDAKGRWRWLMSRGQVVERDSQGQPILLAGTHQDMTERKQAEDDLKASQALLDQTVRRYHQFFNNMRNIIICIGHKGEESGQHGYSKGGALLLGRDVNEMAGTRRDADGRADVAMWYESIHPDDRAFYLAAERRRKDEGIPYDISFRVRHPKTGDMRWMREIAWSTDNPSTEETYFDGYIVDVTKEKAIEEALRESEARYQSAERVALLSHWVIVPTASDQLEDQKMIYSPMAAKILGVDVEQVPKTANEFISKFMHPDDRKGFLEGIRRARAERLADATYRYRIVRPDGAVRQIVANVKYEYDAEGRFATGFGSIQDVTALIKTEEALRQSETLYRLAEQAAHLVHWSSQRPPHGDSMATRPAFSAGAEQLFGIPVHRMNFTHREYAEKIIHPDDRARVLRALDRISSSKIDEYTLDYRILRPDNTVRHVHEVIKDFYDDDGKWARSFGTMLDLTEQRETEQALRSALEAAEAASNAKTQFLANTSHELRTPLNAIIGFSEVMSRELLGPMHSAQYLQYSGDIHTSALHLLGIINDLLDLSRVESGQFVLSEEAVEIPLLVDACMNFVRARADKQGVELRTNMPTGLPRISVDQRSIKQVLLNLLSNAIKFTPIGGSVEVSAEFSRTGIEIIVHDTGIGMSQQEVIEAVKPFVQVENWLVRKHEGIGLGLPIAKKLCELHGGALVIESEKGKGTKMIVRLPIGRVISAVQPAAD